MQAKTFLVQVIGDDNYHEFLISCDQSIEWQVEVREMQEDDRRYRFNDLFKRDMAITFMRLFPGHSVEIEELEEFEDEDEDEN